MKTVWISDFHIISKNNEKDKIVIISIFFLFFSENQNNIIYLLNIIYDIKKFK